VASGERLGLDVGKTGKKGPVREIERVKSVFFGTWCLGHKVPVGPWVRNYWKEEAKGRAKMKKGGRQGCIVFWRLVTE